MLIFHSQVKQAPVDAAVYRNRYYILHKLNPLIAKKSYILSTQMDVRCCYFYELLIYFHPLTLTVSCSQMINCVYNQLVHLTTVLLPYTTFLFPVFLKAKSHNTLLLKMCQKLWQLMMHSRLRLSVTPYHPWWESANVGQLIQLVQSPSMAGTGCRQSLPIIRAFLTLF